MSNATQKIASLPTIGEAREAAQANFDAADEAWSIAFGEAMKADPAEDLMSAGSVVRAYAPGVALRHAEACRLLVGLL